MKNPYEVLGVSQNATNDEISRARDRIVEQYALEDHQDNPLAHLAQEKIQEANAAYEEIIRMRNDVNAGPSKHLDIRRLINNNRITEAEELLTGVPFNDRDAEWYFLKGTVQHSRGWLEDAYDNFTKAVQMNPQNAEYRAALSQLQWQRQTGQPQGNPNKSPQPVVTGCGVCDMCATLYCASMCCQCCGTGCR